jgi:hypothetical protein
MSRQVPVSHCCPISVALSETLNVPVRTTEVGISLIENPTEVYPLSSEAYKFLLTFDTHTLGTLPEENFPVFLDLPKLM